MTQAPIAITCGEPAGIGPEIAAAAWDALRAEMPILWIGDPAHLPAGTPFETVANPGEAAALSRRLAGSRPPFCRWPAHPWTGRPGPCPRRDRRHRPRRGSGAIGPDRRDLHRADPQKGATGRGRFCPSRHTEYLAALAGGVDVVMMLASDALRVVPATIHIALSAVPAALTPEGLAQVIRITAEGLRTGFGIPAPRIAVAGLNPHAGEGGAMGREELDWINALIPTLGTDTLTVTGPHSADTLFHAAARARYDAAVCMYHDQALIPIKTLDFDGGVNVTLGLPFIRTSPDHGTAFDIAGTGTARPASMIAALRMAARMAQART